MSETQKNVAVICEQPLMYLMTLWIRSEMSKVDKPCYLYVYFKELKLSKCQDGRDEALPGVHAVRGGPGRGAGGLGAAAALPQLQAEQLRGGPAAAGQVQETLPAAHRRHRSDWQCI